MTVLELINELEKYPKEAKVFLRGGHLPEVNAINPTGPHCIVWIDKLGTLVLAEIANRSARECPRHDEWERDNGDDDE